MSAPVNRAMRSRANAPTAAAPAAVAAKTARAAVSQAPAKSMRQLNKENDDLQLRVEELAQSLYTVQAGKQAVKAAFEKSAKEKDELIDQLQCEMETLQTDAERQLSNTNSALHKATEEVREKAAHAEEADAAQQKLSTRVNEYQACLESVGVNAVSLKEWTQRDSEKQQDVIMLEEQIQKAMDELKDSRKALQEDVQREEDFSQTIAEVREQLKLTREAADKEGAASDGEDTASETGDDDLDANDVTKPAAANTENLKRENKEERQKEKSKAEAVRKGGEAEREAEEEKNGEVSRERHDEDANGTPYDDIAKVRDRDDDVLATSLQQEAALAEEQDVDGGSEAALLLAGDSMENQHAEVHVEASALSVLPMASKSVDTDAVEEAAAALLLAGDSIEHEQAESRVEDSPLVPVPVASENVDADVAEEAAAALLVAVDFIEHEQAKAHVEASAHAALAVASESVDADAGNKAAAALFVVCDYTACEDWQEVQVEVNLEEIAVGNLVVAAESGYVEAPGLEEAAAVECADVVCAAGSMQDTHEVDFGADCADLHADDAVVAAEDVGHVVTVGEEMTSEVQVVGVASTDSGVIGGVDMVEEGKGAVEEDMEEEIADGDASVTNQVAAEDSSTCFAALVMMPNTSAEEEEEEEEEEENPAMDEAEVEGAVTHDQETVAVQETMDDDKVKVQVQVAGRGAMEMVGDVAAESAEPERRLSVAMTQLLNPAPSGAGDCEFHDNVGGKEECAAWKSGNKRLSAVADLLNPDVDSVVASEVATELVKTCLATVYDKAVC